MRLAPEGVRHKAAEAADSKLQENTYASVMHPEDRFPKTHRFDKVGERSVLNLFEASWELRSQGA